jgi:hypothetical protein
MKLPVRARVLLFFFSFPISVTTIVAQLSPADSIFYQKAVNNAISLYHQSSGDQSGLYNGIQNGGYLFSFTEGNPFFYSDKPGAGTVVYDGVLYENLQLQYDELKEVIIVQDASHRIQLLNERISGFTVFNNRFTRLEKDSLSSALVSTGFYNLLYEGKVSVLKKEIKELREELRSSSEGILRFIDVKKYYYIKKNNEYYAVKNKKSVLGIFADHRKEIQQYIRKNKLSFRKNPDETLVKTSGYYDRLIK